MDNVCKKNMYGGPKIDLDVEEGWNVVYVIIMWLERKCFISFCLLFFQIICLFFCQHKTIYWNEHAVNQFQAKANILDEAQS